MKKYFYLPSFPSSLLTNIISLSFSVRNIGFLLSISHVCTIQEVQQYQTAIEHIAQTGLRDTIGKHELSELLQERDKIAEDLQQVLDGIPILRVLLVRPSESKILPFRKI